MCLPFSAIQDDERLSAEEMDERRRQNIAYEYLCHLEEAKRYDWRSPEKREGGNERKDLKDKRSLMAHAD